MKSNLELETSPNEATMEKSAWQKVQTYFNIVNHIMICIVAVYMSFLCYGTGNVPISWHAWLCTIGVRILSFFFFSQILIKEFLLSLVSATDDGSYISILFTKRLVSTTHTICEKNISLGFTNNWFLGGDHWDDN